MDVAGAAADPADRPDRRRADPARHHRRAGRRRCSDAGDAAMSLRLVAAAGAALLAVFLTCGGLLASLAGSGAGCTALPSPGGSVPAGAATAPPGGYPTVGAWGPPAVGNAATVVGVGA